MFEVIGLLLSFSVMMVLVLKKINQAIAILVGVMVVGLFSVLSPLGYWHALSGISLNRQNYELIISIALIGCLGSILKDSGMMADLTKELKKVISTRIIVALIPALMGLLPMPGGALLSAPMIDEEANELGINSELKTFITLLLDTSGFGFYL